jgi:hypothetical protein
MCRAVRIDRVAAQYEVWLDETFPFSKIKVKVIERRSGDYLGVANVAVRGRISGEPEFISGLGATVDEALQDAVMRFLQEAAKNMPAAGFREEDFVWSACEEF